MLIALALSGILLRVPTSAAAPRQEMTRQTLQFQGVVYTYQVFAPFGHDRERTLPAILLLHGAGGRGAEMISVWRDFAVLNEIVLIAPDMPRKEAFESIAPQFFRQVVEDVTRDWSIDPRRVYVFGHSMGGYLAFDAAMFDSDYFAAVAVHASSIAADYRGIVDQAKRKIPIALYVGDRDPWAKLEDVRATKELLLAHHFPVHYVELAGHDHNYGALSAKVNADAWAFLRKQKLR